MSEVINLAKGNGDDHVYEAAARILADELPTRYSYVINNWNKPLPTDTRFPIIFISTSDETHQVPECIDDPRVKYVFKQYHPMTNIQDVNTVVYHRQVHGIPLCHLNGVVNTNTPIENREYDWCWMGQFDPYRRVDFKMAVDRLCNNTAYKFKCDWYTGWNNGVSKEEYSEILNNTKIALVPCGSASYETFRFFEAMMCGCVVIGVDLPRVAFYNEAPYVKISNWSDIEAVIGHTMSNINMDDASKKAYAWYDKYCSPRGLADYIKSKMED